MMTVRTRKWNCMSKICAEHAMYGGERKRWSREVNGRGDKHESVNIRRYVPHWAVKACTSEYPSVVVIIIDKAGATTAFVAWANCTIFFSRYIAGGTEQLVATVPSMERVHGGGCGTVEGSCSSADGREY